jgi:hypothetical protein
MPRFALFIEWHVLEVTLGDCNVHDEDNPCLDNPHAPERDAREIDPADRPYL